MVSDGGQEQRVAVVQRLRQEVEHWREIAQQRGLEVERLQQQKQQLTASLLAQTESHRESAEAENDLRAQVERLTQENARLRHEQARAVAIIRPMTPAGRDVIETAKAWRVAEESDEITVMDLWSVRKSLIAAVDALTQPEEPDGGP